MIVIEQINHHWCNAACFVVIEVVAAANKAESSVVIDERESAVDED